MVLFLDRGDLEGRRRVQAARNPDSVGPKNLGAIDSLRGARKDSPAVWMGADDSNLENPPVSMTLCKAMAASSSDGFADAMLAEQ